ncbi:secondary thiamine-phosphate synthase enzyme YjbQ [Desulfonatronovibrio hydrogenovorans]|uniref:secondary thiamine-phosphate synthase enzyme YjbQ n=1 Tax=Desulfonatronovibrio hydrogenovorans TaxID=53245 RepID=UPI0009FFDFB2|nr:secondary thiamine-phosphate synthase enzyme YjbQ [Desulfonatronovibrio hydrogenovorans]
MSALRLFTGQIQVSSRTGVDITDITGQIQVSSRTGVDITDITGQLQDLVRKSDIVSGVLHATCTGSTGSLTCIEYEPGVIADLTRAVNELALPDREYEHEKAWHDGNGHSHVQAALLGPSVSIQIRSRKCVLGTWQQVVAINHDVKPRTRKIEISILGI